MEHSAALLDHFEHPRNVGSFPPDDDDVGTALVGLASGDVVKLQIRVGAGDVIADARFRTQGSAASIAAASLASEWVKGRTLDEALSIGNAEIARAHALPPDKLHCSILVEDAIRAAVDDYRAKHSTTTQDR
jgi:nitrogen fixation NifU-like protein